MSTTSDTAPIQGGWRARIDWRPILPSLALLTGCVRIGYDPESASESMGGVGGRATGAAGSGGSSRVLGASGGGAAGATADLSGSRVNGGASAGGTTSGFAASIGGLTGGTEGGTWSATGGAPLASGGQLSSSGGSALAAGGTSSGGSPFSGGVSSAMGGSVSGGVSSTMGGFVTGGVSSAQGGSVTGGVTSAQGGSATGGNSPETGGTNASGANSSGGVSSGGTSATSSSGTGACVWSSVAPVFGSPTSVGSLNTTASEIDPVLSHDGLTLYYVAYRSSQQGNDIYRATRAKATDKFGAGTPYDEVSSTYNDTHFFAGPDNLEAFIASNRPVNYGSTDIFRATRTTTTYVWGTFTSSATINSNSSEFNPHLESDQLTLWFDATDRLDGAGQQDIFYTTRATSITGFGSPTPATELNSTANERDASLTDDGLVILFQSDRDGAYRVYFATRASRSAPFGLPVIVTSLDPYKGSLIDPFISPDGCSIYFSAVLSGGSGSNDIYRVDVL